MSAIVVLLAIGLILAALAVGVFVAAVRTGQFDDSRRPAERLVAED